SIFTLVFYFLTYFFFFFQAEDGIRDPLVTGVQTCALPISAFVCVLVPYYWTTYTPWNFLYFCDLALLITCVALWLESPFLTSTQAVGIVLPQMLWVADFGARLVAGVHLSGMTWYLLDPEIP